MDITVRDLAGGHKITGVEIGAGLGKHAETLMRNLPLGKLFLIDPFMAYKEFDDNLLQVNNRKATLEENMDSALIITKKRLKRFGDKITYLRCFSHDAVDDVPDNIDFVYIDGNHSYEYAKRDIQLYWKKVKSGGVLGGHNYQGEFPGVIKAVNEFIDKNSLVLKARDLDWWIIKP